MERREVVQEEYVSPVLTRYGSVEELTLQVKTKQLGPGDDVMIVDSDLTLADVS